jgi:hypothetical protein
MPLTVALPPEKGMGGFYASKSGITACFYARYKQSESNPVATSGPALFPKKPFTPYRDDCFLYYPQANLFPFSAGVSVTTAKLTRHNGKIKVFLPVPVFFH